MLILILILVYYFKKTLYTSIITSFVPVLLDQLVLILIFNTKKYN